LGHLDMSHPIVSIGMPVYNGAKYIWCAAQSILAQDYEDFELIISDNASIDETESICRELAERDGRIRYFRNDTNVGASRNYNRVFRLARGQFFKWAAHDDECHPAMLRRCVEVLERAPDRVTMVYPLAELIDEEGKTLVPILDHIESRDPRPHRRLAHILWFLNMCDPVFGLYKVEYLKKTQLIGPFFGADYVLLSELAMLGEIWELGEVLFRLRAHPGRSMQSNPSARLRDVWYDPAAARRLFIMPDWERMVWELLKSARRSSLPPAEKLRCCLVVPGMHYWRRFRNAGGRMKHRLRASLCLVKRTQIPRIPGPGFSGA
jgi:glycosyltransferase involved in cell wall biosynthesis